MSERTSVSGSPDGLDAIDPRDGVEDDLPPLRLLVIHAGRQGDRAERDLRAAVRPRHAGVGHVVAGLRQLHEHAEPDRLLGQPWADLVEQEVLRTSPPRLSSERYSVPASGRMRNRP